MHNPFLNFDAAIHAIQGRSDSDTIMHGALGDRRLVQIIAMAKGVNPIVHAVAALSSELPNLLDARIVADPTLHDILVPIVKGNKGYRFLDSWTEIAPADWGQTHAATLVDAARKRTCNPGAAAALIGPKNDAAAILSEAIDIQHAIRRWGQSTPENPTAWMEALSSGERNRLLNEIQRFPSAAAFCLPWLPPDIGHSMIFDDMSLDRALDAFTEASPMARAMHAALVQRMVAQANSIHLDSLTRLACVMESESLWSRVQTLIQTSPDDAAHVVIAAPWDDLDATVRAVILECADQSDICTAVAAARGRKAVGRITEESSAAFFAALEPKVWDALLSDDQRRWLSALWRIQVYLAVRSLGPRPEILAHATFNEALVHATQRFTRDTDDLRWTLLPVALRDIDPNAAYALFNALQTPPPDPGAFFAIASEQRDPDRLARIRTTVRTQSDVQIVLALRHGAISGETVLARCAALQDALRGRTCDDVAQFMPFLDAEDCAVLTPDPDAPVQRLARSNRKKKMRQALDRLASLPPEVAVPTLIALNQQEPRDVASAAAAIASALRAHGDLFLTIADTLNDADLRNALLPLPKDAAQADALRALARDNPLAARRLAHALHVGDGRSALHALLTAPPHAADAVWQAIDDAMRSAIIAGVGAASFGIDLIVVNNPIIALALAAVQSDNADLRDAGIAAAAAQHAIIRANWDRLRPETQRVLIAHQWFADLPTPSPQPAIKRARLR